MSQGTRSLKGLLIQSSSSDDDNILSLRAENNRPLKRRRRKLNGIPTRQETSASTSKEIKIIEDISSSASDNDDVYNIPRNVEIKFELPIALLSQEEAECPVCFDILQPPISSCDNGHSICGPCKTLMQLCPQCRSPFMFRNLILDKLIERMHFACDDCNTMLPYPLVALHKANCFALKIVYCNHCQEAIRSNIYIAHIKEDLADTNLPDRLQKRITQQEINNFNEIIFTRSNEMIYEWHLKSTANKLLISVKLLDDKKYIRWYVMNISVSFGTYVTAYEDYPSTYDVSDECLQNLAIYEIPRKVAEQFIKSQPFTINGTALNSPRTPRSLKK